MKLILEGWFYCVSGLPTWSTLWPVFHAYFHKSNKFKLIVNFQLFGRRNGITQHRQRAHTFVLDELRELAAAQQRQVLAA